MHSKVNPDKQLSSNNYLVSLVITKQIFSTVFTSPFGHAILVFETLTENGDLKSFACDFAPLYGSRSSYLISTPGLIRTTEPSPNNIGFHNPHCAWNAQELKLQELEYTQKITGVRSAYIPSAKVLEVMNKIKNDEENPPAYQFAGTHTKSFGGLGENCFTLCHRYLLELGIPMKLSCLSYLFGAIPTLELNNWPTDDLIGQNILDNWNLPATREERNAELIYAASKGDCSKILQLIRAGVDINYYVPTGGHPFLSYTPFLVAVSQGHLPAVKLLVEHGANINARTGYLDEKRSSFVDFWKGLAGGFIFEIGHRVFFGPGRTAKEIAEAQGFQKIIAFLNNPHNANNPPNNPPTNNMAYVAGQTLLAAPQAHPNVRAREDEEFTRTVRPRRE